MRARLAALMIFAAAIPAFPQQPLVETIEVRVANIDVVVRDRQGNAVTGLAKDDFELFDDGVRQPITNFYEVRRGDDASAPAGETDVPLEVRQRRLVVFLDSASLTPSRKKAVLDSLLKFIDRMRPEDQCMLVSWRFETEVVTPFTHDQTALRRGIDRVARLAPVGERSSNALGVVRRRIEQWVDDAVNGIVGWPEAYQNSISIVDRYGEQLMTEERQLFRAVDDISTTMAGLQGKKVLVLVGEHLPRSPAADLYRFVNEQFGTHISSGSKVSFETAVGVAGNSTPAQIEDMAREASARGVTIYTIGAAPLDADISADNSMAPDYGYTFSRDANTASALQTIADITGGVAITRTSNFDLAFDTIGRDLSSYYSLGYKPAGEGGHEHTIRVKAKNAQYAVRARQTFVIQSADDQMSDRAVANLYVDMTATNDWPISVRMKSPKRDGRKFIVPIEVVIPATLTLIPQQESLNGSFVLYFAVGDSQGRTSTVLRRPEDLKIPVAAEKTVRAKPMTFTTALRVDPGESMLSVAIVDQLSGATGFARARIAAR